MRERTYWHLLREGYPTAAAGSPLAGALAETPEARGEGGPIARLAYELVARQLGRPPHSQGDLIRALDERAAVRLPADALALRQLRADEVQAYGLVRFSNKDAVADRLKILGKAKPASQVPTAPVSTRTLSDLVPGLAGEVLGAAGCRVDGMQWALLEVRHDATGHRERLGVALPPGLAPECQKAVRALLMTGLVEPERPARANQTNLLLLPLSSRFFACVGGKHPAAEALQSVGGRITEPKKTRNVAPVYPRAAIDERKQGVVILDATVSPQGCVSAAEVVRGVDVRLDAAALAAVLQWEYTPTLLNGVPVPVMMTVTVNFKLN
jgi:TonB family protein